MREKYPTKQKSLEFESGWKWWTNSCGYHEGSPLGSLSLNIFVLLPETLTRCSGARSSLNAWPLTRSRLMELWLMLAKTLPWPRLLQWTWLTRCSHFLRTFSRKMVWFAANETKLLWLWTMSTKMTWLTIPIANNLRPRRNPLSSWKSRLPEILMIVRRTDSLCLFLSWLQTPLDDKLRLTVCSLGFHTSTFPRPPIGISTLLAYSRISKNLPIRWLTTSLLTNVCSPFLKCLHFLSSDTTNSSVK